MSGVFSPLLREMVCSPIYVSAKPDIKPCKHPLLKAVCIEYTLRMPGHELGREGGPTPT